MIELKKEIIAKDERGIRMSDLATDDGMVKLMISTILKHEEAVKSADVAKGMKALTKQ